MEQIDLTLSGDFTEKAKRNRLDETAVQYNEKLDYKDQRRSIISILGKDSFLWNWFPNIEIKEYLEFFGDKDNKGWEELKNHECVLSITGLLTETLRLEYDSGYGNDSICDCCGGYRSHILNSQKYGICDRCEKHSKYRNEKFWESRREVTLEETWID